LTNEKVPTTLFPLRRFKTGQVLNTGVPKVLLLKINLLFIHTHEGCLEMIWTGADILAGNKL